MADMDFLELLIVEADNSVKAAKDPIGCREDPDVDVDDDDDEPPPVPAAAAADFAAGVECEPPPPCFVGVPPFDVEPLPAAHEDRWDGFSDE